MTARPAFRPLLPRAPAAPPTTMASLAAASGAVLLLLLAWGLVETRSLGGDPVWLKPAKFALAFVVTFATLALVESRLSPAWASGWTLRITGAVAAVAAVFELGYVTAQAVLGQGSHYNTGTPFHAMMYQLMGVGAVTVMLAIGVYGIVAWRDRAARLSPGLRAAVALGFVVTVALTLPTAGYLSVNGGHFVGPLPPEPRAIPFLGWSLSTGDLRPAHFLALHAMQGIPLYVLLRERTARAVARSEVAAVTLGWAALTGAVFLQALAGRPLLPL